MRNVVFLYFCWRYLKTKLIDDENKNEEKGQKTEVQQRESLAQS